MIDTTDMTPEEKQVLAKALNLYTRLLMGQVDAVLDPILMGNGLQGDVPEFIMQMYRNSAETMRGNLTGRYTFKTEPSIGNGLVPNDARIARRLEAMVLGETIPLSLYNRDGTVKD